MRALLRRIGEILRAEGSAGLIKRFRTLTRRGAPLMPANGEHLPGALLVGHAEDILGVGENLRSVARALDDAGIPYAICDVRIGGLSTSNAPLCRRANLFCLNADEMDSALAELGSELFANAYNIGLWMWELALFPQQWAGNFRYVREIWAQSHFVHEAIAQISPVPTIWMPQPVEPGPADPAWAHRLGVPTDRFSFLCFVDFRSRATRKNPGGAAEAFRMAFGDRTDNPAVLVVKTLGADRHPNDYGRFMDSARDLGDRLVVIDKSLADAEIKGLLCGCSAFVSLHRSEGFGRGIAEAMYYGKPTIATAYSGNMDFCNPDTCALVDYRLVPVREGEYPFWRNQVWADPNIEGAAHWMQRLAANPTFAVNMGKRAQKDIRASHGAAAVGRRMRVRLADLGLI
jgi:glycosyltransferase involved in cell wall biosynthesis